VIESRTTQTENIPSEGVPIPGTLPQTPTRTSTLRIVGRPRVNIQRPQVMKTHVGAPNSAKVKTKTVTTTLISQLPRTESFQWQIKPDGLDFEDRMLLSSD
jgi:hypothetical protein